MGQTIPHQHPAVVLRAQYRQLRAVLAVAMVAVVGLAAAVVVLALDDDGDAGLGSATQVVAPVPSHAVRSDGGPEESAVAATLGSQPTAVGTEESRVAAAIGSARNASTENGGPDESAVARAISGR